MFGRNKVEKGLSKRKLKKIKKAMENMGSNSVITLPWLETPLIPSVMWNETPLKDPMDVIKARMLDRCCGACGTLARESASFCAECGVSL